MMEVNIGMFSNRMNELIRKHQLSIDLYLEALSTRERQKAFTDRWFLHNNEMIYHGSQSRYYDNEINKILVTVSGNLEIQNIINANEYLHDKLPATNFIDNPYTHTVLKVGR